MYDLLNYLIKQKNTLRKQASSDGYWRKDAELLIPLCAKYHELCCEYHNQLMRLHDVIEELEKQLKQIKN